MLTTNEILNFDDVDLESLDASSNSCNNDGETYSDEDFLQTLSNDLDIPMLLDQNNEILNFDIRQDDIFSEVMTSDNSWSQYDLLNNFDNIDFTQLDSVKIKLEPCMPSSPESLYTDSIQSASPTPSQCSDGSRSSIEIKTENSMGMDTPPVSPLENSSRSMLLNAHSKNIKNKQKKLVFAKTAKTSACTTKPCVRVPIQPKPVCMSPSKQRRKIVPSDNFVIKNEVELLNQHVIKNIVPTNGSLLNTNSRKMVVLENIPVQKMAQVVNINPVQLSSVPVLYPNDSESQVVSFQSDFDVKALKRQQRMIKNRESACLSRKKKKDYLMSLEKENNDLKMENQKLRIENGQLKERLFGKKKGITLQLPNKASKNTAFLLAVLFMVSINVGSIGGLFNFKTQSAQSIQAEESILSDVKIGRNLLWTSEQQVDAEIPITNISDIQNNLPVCPMLYVNQSESVRLAEELHRWIVKPYNISSTKRIRKRSYIKEKFIGSELRPSLYRMNKRTKRISQNDNELQVFWPRPETLYSEFFEAINRRDDTFYVVSFNADNMLLPALYHNNTRRPKMSLLLPARLPNETTTEQNVVSLMQIDCEVVDTRFIHVNSRSIPQHFRNPGNFTKDQYNPGNSNNSTTANATTKKYYKPYFIKNNAFKPKSETVFSDKSNKLLK